MKPKCCNKDAEWIVQSVSLAYWFCRECKNEVTEKSEESKLERSMDVIEAFYPNSGAHIVTLSGHTFNSKNVCIHCQQNDSYLASRNWPKCLHAPNPAPASLSPKPQGVAYIPTNNATATPPHHDFSGPNNDCAFCRMPLCFYIMNNSPACTGSSTNLSTAPLSALLGPRIHYFSGAAKDCTYCGMSMLFFFNQGYPNCTGQKPQASTRPTIVFTKGGHAFTTIIGKCIDCGCTVGTAMLDPNCPVSKPQVYTPLKKVRLTHTWSSTLDKCDKCGITNEQFITQLSSCIP